MNPLPDYSPLHPVRTIVLPEVEYDMTEGLIGEAELRNLGFGIKRPIADQKIPEMKKNESPHSDEKKA